MTSDSSHGRERYNMNNEKLQIVKENRFKIAKRVRDNSGKLKVK